jgi:Tfp pilus assembly PilM family ATPase/Tfp pilus assembly protein PilN
MTTFLDRFFGTFLGIEFKKDTLVVTHLKNTLSGIRLLSSSAFPLKDDDSNLSEIREYIRGQGVVVSKVFVSIPDKWAIIKFTELPSPKGRGRDALSQLMRFEIERHIPFHIEDVFYDFQVVEEKDGVCTVVFVAVQKERINYIREFLEKLYLSPHGVTISSFAALNAIELSGTSAGRWQEILGFTRKSNVLGQKGETNALLYIDDKMSASLAIIKDGFCRHLKPFLFNTSKPLETSLNDIAIYLNDGLSELSIAGINKLILSGDISLMPTLVDELKEKLGVNVTTLDPMSGLPDALKGAEIKGLASVGACLAGLGIGTFGINLLPHKVGLEAKKIASLTTKIFITLIVFLIIGIFISQAVKEKIFLSKVEKVLKENEPAIMLLEELSSDINSFKRKRDFLLRIKENEITLEVLAELTNILPKDSWITNLNYKGFNIKDKKKTGGELIISGYAASSSRLISILEDSPFFEKVEFVGPIRKAKGKEMFKLRTYIVNPLVRK